MSGAPKVDAGAEVEVEADGDVCASCGKAAVDEIKLKKCACNLVKYCSVDCQKNHRPQHKKACKKRMNKIHDDALFTQPNESHLGECPLCCLPMPLELEKSSFYSCCSNSICNGCVYASCMSNKHDKEMAKRCPFCRDPSAITEMDRKKMKRIEANDPAALTHVGTTKHYRNGDYEGAFQYWTKAAELGDPQAHYKLACLYGKGEGVEKDEKKYVYHSEKAAIGGHPTARHNLAVIDFRHGRYDRALKHYIIATNLGNDDSLEIIKRNFWGGSASPLGVTKEVYEAALKAHQAAVDATKSPEREIADEICG